MAFLIKAATPNEWKVVAATISTFVEEATFDAAPEGLAFTAMDPSHVALVDLYWPNSAFEKYDCEGQTRFSFRVADFVKLIRRADSRDSVEITMDGGMLILRMADGYRREFNLHLIESSRGATPLPKLTFNAKILMSGRAFERILNDISAISDHVTVEALKDRVTFLGRGDAGTASATLNKGGADLLELEVKEESKATYSIDYLLNMAKAAGTTSESVAFEYSSKMPLRLEFKLGGAGRIHFYLAPRVE